MVRQLLLWFCFVMVAWLALVNAPSWLTGVQQPAHVLAQVSPLASPLTVTNATTTSENAPTAAIPPITVPANGSSISVVLVAAVFVGIMGVIGLVIWRRR